MEQHDNFIKQQKLIILITLISFVMMIMVSILSWYVFDYSTTNIQKNNETISALTRNLYFRSTGKVLDVTQKDANSVSALDFSKKEESVDYANLSAEDVIKMVGRHILLADGNMTVASVTNIEGLRANYPEVFKYSKNGDKLIFYPLGIIIYDPALDKVVDVMRILPADTVIPRSVTEEK